MATSPTRVIYVDHRANAAQEYTRESPPNSSRQSMLSQDSECFPCPSGCHDIEKTISSLLSTFSHVLVYPNADSCVNFLESIGHFAGKQAWIPVLAHTMPEEKQHGEEVVAATHAEDRKSEQCLKEICSRITSVGIKEVLLPVALVPHPIQTNQAGDNTRRSLGALDVLPSPLTEPLPTNYMDQLIHRVQRERPAEGADLTKNLVYNLLSDLYDSHSQRFPPGQSSESYIEPSRREAVVEAFGSWSFAAHDFTDTELMYGASRILQHAMNHRDLEDWLLAEDAILEYLSATRNSYNTSVIYHNFHHSMDVLQAVFQFLVAIGAIDPLKTNGAAAPAQPTGLALLIRPFDVLTLLVAAIGHDVGHPGVNNLFLVKTKAAVAQLYNDHSVLESYHCAASSRILCRYWPAAHNDVAMRKLMISSILSTDMTLHGQYTTRLDALRQTYAHRNNEDTDTQDNKKMEEHRELICCLLIKCADICNVARPFHIARKWAVLVTDEFAHQGDLEKAADIGSCLFGGPPSRDNLTDMAKRQLGFINAFVLDLFTKMTEILPNMQFAVDMINKNKESWQQILKEQDQEKQAGQPFDLPTQGRRPSTQVPPAQPQEVPDSDPSTQQVPEVQPQSARPSIPWDLPEEDSNTPSTDWDDSVAPDDKSYIQNGRPSSSSSTGKSSPCGRYSTAPGAAPGSPSFGQPFAKSYHESVPRHRSSGIAAAAAHSPKLAHVREPRRSSLGNINLGASSETPDGGSRRSSGTYIAVTRPSHTPHILSSNIISASQLRVDGLSENEGDGTVHRPFSFSSEIEELSVIRNSISQCNTAESQGFSRSPHEQMASIAQHLSDNEDYSTAFNAQGNFETNVKGLIPPAIHASLNTTTSHFANSPTSHDQPENTSDNDVLNNCDGHGGQTQDWGDIYELPGESTSFECHNEPYYLHQAPAITSTFAEEEPRTVHIHQYLSNPQPRLDGIFERNNHQDHARYHRDMMAADDNFIAEEIHSYQDTIDPDPDTDDIVNHSRFIPMPVCDHVPYHVQSRIANVNSTLRDPVERVQDSPQSRGQRLRHRVSQVIGVFGSLRSRP